MRGQGGRLAFAACAAALSVPAAAQAGAAPPAGATARCADGSYSFSQHRSGTCSHHGGVAVWLDAGPARFTGPAGVRVGRTILLARRTRTGPCRVGVRPDRRCSPGAYYSRLSTAVLCRPSFRTTSIRDVSQSEKDAVEREYGLAARPYGRALEIDHIVPLELGGSNSIANLYPERADPQPGYHVKDRLENRLHALVCAGAMRLRTAQRGIAGDWRALYRQVFAAAP